MNFKQLMSIQTDFHQMLMSMLSTVSTENPLEFAHTMYDSISPTMITEALKSAKDIVKKENIKQGNPCDAFLCIGGDGINEMFFQGIITALLWLPHYLDDAVEAYKLSRTDVETCKSVLDKVKLPKMFDAYDVKDSDGMTTKIQPSSCRHYASFLAAIIRWATTPTVDFQQKGEGRSNMEMVRYLTATAMKSFPSVPFSAYYVGSCKSRDGMALSEKLTKSIKFDEYMSGISMQLNQPRFVVSMNGAPLVGVAGHPLSNILVGSYSPESNKAEWFGLYAQNTEFERLCTENGFTTEQIINYTLGASKNKHEKILASNDSQYNTVAKFVEKHELLKYGFDKYHQYDREADYNV